MEFVVKKLRSETLGEYLSAVRAETGFSFSQVVDRTGIIPKYLQALEAGDFTSLPEPVYVTGFLRTLAQLYGVSAAELVAQFNRERALYRERFTDSRTEGWAKILVGGVTRRAAVIAGLVSVGAILLFLGFQIWMVGGIPELVVYKPLSGDLYPTGMVTVTGKASPGSEVSFNNQTVFAGSDGTFSGTISFLAGPQTLEVTARSRFGKTNKQIVTFLVSDNPVVQVGSAPSVPPVVLGVSIESGVEASVSLGGRVQQLVPGESYFAGSNRILLSTRNAGKTRIRLNGREIGPLGKMGEVLTDVPFSSIVPGHPAIITK
jgi:transcriptional regulator with XRE-family HTH domain